jgi:hypothetical protein
MTYPETARETIPLDRLVALVYIRFFQHKAERDMNSNQLIEVLQSNDRYPQSHSNQLLGELRHLKQFVVAKLPNKVPLNPITGLNAAVNDHISWGTFDNTLWVDNCEQYVRGFVLTPNDPYICIDLDTYKANGDHNVIALHQHISELFKDTYQESSPSGGLHIWLKGKWNGLTRPGTLVEVYATARYMTVTGRLYIDAPIMHCQPQLDALDALLATPVISQIPTSESQPQTKSDDEICLTAQSASNGDLFMGLWRGNWQGLGYPSQSEGDLAFINIVAFYSDNKEQIARIYYDSPLFKNTPDPQKKKRKAKRSYLFNENYGLITKAFDQKNDSQRFAGIVAEVKVAVDGFDSWPEPMNEDAFIGYAGDYVELVEPTTESDPHALLFTLLQMFGCAVSNHPYFVTDGKKQRTNLLGILAGPTNTGKKGTAYSNVKTFYEMVSPEFFKKNLVTGMTSGEGIIYKIRDPRDKDEGEGDKRLFIYESEFAKPLNNMKREGSNLGGTIRQVFDCDKIGSLARGNQDSCLEPRVAIHAHSTIEEIKSLLTEMDKVNGFANRFLYVCTRRTKQLPHGGNSDLLAMQSLAEKIKNVAIRASTQVAEMKWDAEARELWATVYGDLTDDEDGKLLSRGAPIVVRLAMIYALMDQATYMHGIVFGESHTIRIEHLKAALEVWRYCKDSAIHIFGDARFASLVNAVFAKLKAAGNTGMTQTQINQSFQKNKTAFELQRALTLLEQKKLVKSTQQSTAGRPVTTWTAN